MRLLPSEKVFRVFEACAVHQSFTLAAESLGVSQSAVSQQIKTLEETLEVTLFHRQGRQVVLSSAGRNILEAQKNAFQQIRDAVQQERIRKRELALTVQVLPGFSVRWLLPRIADFEQRHPDVKLTIITEANAEYGLSRAADLFILYSSEHMDAWLSQDHLFPVASPEFISKHGLEGIDGTQLEEQLQALPLLGDVPSQTDDPWAYWGLKQGVTLPLERIQRYPHANMSLMLAELGQGIAIGRTYLVADAIASGVLVELPGGRIPASAGYSLRFCPHRPMTDGGLKFQQWITQAIAQTPIMWL